MHGISEEKDEKMKILEDRYNILEAYLRNNTDSKIKFI